MSISTRIVQIGNSQGIRIPKALLEQSGIQGEVTLTVEENRIIIAPVRHPREGWEAAFAKVALQGDDELIDPKLGSDWDDEEWVWE